MDIRISKFSTLQKYFRVQLLTIVSKQYVLVFYNKISKLISFEKFNNFALLNPLNTKINCAIFTIVTCINKGQICLGLVGKFQGF